MAVKINGNASPTPIEIKIKKMMLDEEVKAKVSAVPSKGALHGVDSIVAKTPLKKSP